MKIIIGAIALLIAGPAAAQAAPADAHSGHAQHGPQHGQTDPKQHGQGDHKQHGADHSKPMECCKDGKHGECCDKAKQTGKTMECCAKQGEGEDAAAHKGHSA